MMREIEREQKQKLLVLLSRSSSKSSEWSAMDEASTAPCVRVWVWIGMGFYGSVEFEGIDRKAKHQK